MITQLDRGIYLASRSPRRRELLTQIGVRFQLQHMDEWRPAQFSGHHHAAEAGGRKK